MGREEIERELAGRACGGIHVEATLSSLRAGVYSFKPDHLQEVVARREVTIGGIYLNHPRDPNAPDFLTKRVL
ncbi:MAG: hypothetical protein M3336_00760, partial [Chloroflexota bacterium]|nr:hypothetical protein [Chloroflexota bacterium]